jgi:hypothetical protein
MAMGITGQRRALERYSWDQVARRIAGIDDSGDDALRPGLGAPHIVRHVQHQTAGIGI